MALVAIGPAAAQEASPEAVLERLFEAESIEEAWFAPSFLAEVPAAEVGKIVEGLEQRYGPLRGLAGEAGRYTLTLQDAEVPARIVLDAEGRISGLFFEPPVMTTGGIESHVAAITELPGKTSVLVMTGGEARAAHEADAPLAVGSVAKLAILRAVEEAVAQGGLAWGKAVPLDPAWRSLPSGILQDWPEGTPVTVATLANLAVSISDNTATDALLHLAGREAVERVSPRNAPFPSTRELFILKAQGREELREAWIAGDEAERRALLEKIADEPPPPVHELEPAPTLKVEWFMSAREACDLLAAVADLPAFAINPGLADPEAWHSVAYKGGSEAGVLSLATRVVAKDGTAHCVAATWNHTQSLDEEKLTAPYRAILRALKAPAK